jgi:hypothetical protein
LAWQRQIISGDPGTRWVNDTDRVKYQFVCALINTCGFCLQYHLKIGAIWGIPLHHGCRCEQRKILVGAEAPHAFVDFREILDQMDHADQVAAIGASNYRLLKEGVVKWTDIVTPSRVRDLREVVSNKRLSVKTMVAAGVNPKIAETAHATVNTPEHILAEQRQMQLVQQAMASGARLEDLTRQLGQKVASRVSIAAGPDTYGTGPAWAGGPITPKGPAPSQADILLAALGKIKTRDAAIAKAKAEASKKAEPAAPPTEPSPPTRDKSIAWKPTMSAAEAEAWSRDSVIKDELTHVTTGDAATAIQREGFRHDLKENMGRIWGNGTYLGTGPESAEYYREWTKNPQTLKIKVNIKKVLDFDATGENPTATQALDTLVGRLGKREEFERLSKQAEDRNAAVMKEFRTVRRADPKAYRGEAGDKWLADHGYVAERTEYERTIFMGMLRADGYDAVRVTQKSFTAGVGGSQLIVLDPKKITVVHE